MRIRAWSSDVCSSDLLSEDGAVCETTRDDRGVLGVEPEGFDAEIAALRARYSGVPTVLAGMVGSNSGWIAAGYVAAPATIATHTANVGRQIEGGAAIPGGNRSEEGRASGQGRGCKK